MRGDKSAHHRGLFIQRAKGKCNLPVCGDNHCGIQKDYVSLKYNIVIKCNLEALDDKGFLIDNVEFQKWFEWAESVSWEESCEEICKIVHDAFCRRLEDRLQYVVSIKVTLSAVKGVTMTYCNKGEK